jgi:hypothetical protein
MVADAELYNPLDGTFSATGSMNTARGKHVALLLPNGKVLVSGGVATNGTYLPGAELYDPATGTFTAADNMVEARAFHATTLLLNGKVLVIGGKGSGGTYLASAELYDQGTGFDEAARPVIAMSTVGSNIVLAGTGFTGIAEGSSGVTNSSATNYPLVQVRRLDNDQSSLVLNDSTATWSSTSVSTAALAGWPNGHYLATVYASGIPSTSSVLVLAAPDAPTIVNATGGNTQATVTFNPPAFTGSSAISGYTVTSSTGKSATGSGSPITVTGLTNGLACTFTVTATNTVGTSIASAPSNSVTPAPAVTVPGAPTGVTATGGNGQAIVSFTAPVSNGGAAISGYTVTSSTGITASGAGSPITVTGLTNGTACTFTVTATNIAGTGAPSSSSNSVIPAAAITVPGTPTIVTATAGNGQAAVGFTAPVSDGGSPITFYTVTSSTGLSAIGTDSPITVSGLTNGTACTFTVKATNIVGTGVASAPSGSVTPATVPGTPTNVKAVSGSSQAVISFVAPTSNGGAAITGYTVTSSAGGSTSGVASPITVTGLTNGTTYTFTVTATNSMGTSAGSASNSVIPAATLVTTISPSSGSYTAPRSVTLSTDSGGTIYYSTNGATPYIIYTGPIPIIGNVVLKYRTVALSSPTEAIKSAIYSVTSP